MAEPIHRLPGLVLFGAMLGALASGNAARAESPPSGTPGKLIELRYEWHKRQARKQAAELEAKALALPPAEGPSLRNVQDPSALLTELRPILQGDYETLNKAALKLSERAHAQAEAAKRDWEEVYQQKLALRKYADEQQAAHGFNIETGEQAGFRLTPLDAGILVWAVVVFVAALALSKRVRRVSLRRAKRAAGTAAVLLLAAVAGCSDRFTTDTSDWYAREEAALTANVAEATEQANAAVAEADKRWRLATDARARLVAAPGGTDSQVEKLVREGEAQLREHLLSANRDAQLAARLTKEAEAEKGQLATDRAKLDSLRSGARWRSIGFAALRCVAAALLFAVAIAPFRRAVRKEVALVRADANKCPRCFGEKLVVEKSGSISSPSEQPAKEEEASRPRYRAPGRKPSPKPQKKPAATAEPNESGYVECKTCGFRFLRSYQRVRRLCFPVVGVRNSGKTHLLATAYDKVRKGVAPAAATVIPAPSLGDERFDLYIDLILNLKRDAGNTLHDVNTPPDPVMIHVRDTDPSGANTALVNLFDYSGELVNQKIDVDRLKKQAVKMDGFMLFLDPTQLDGRKGGVTLDRQLAALNQFMADMREARKVAVGDVIPVPVAVVIPKIDLLITRNPIGGQSVPFIRKFLGELTPQQPKKTTLEVVRERSELVEDMLELMFRGVDIRSLVESYFGRQVMFFPVSSVSLFENELGVEDLSKRTIAPFGVAEPFLWLLHMHGYEVFA